MTTSVATSIIGAINTTMTASIIPKFMAPERLWWLFGTLALLAGYVAMQFRRKRDTVLFTNVALLDKIAPKRPGWRRHVVAAGFLLAMVAGIGAMAQPMGTVQVPKDRATIILAIDTSLSMEAADVSPDRISAAKAAAKDFVSKLPPKINVGLISFNASAVLRQSPTQDRVALRSAIDRLELGQRTATGDAVDVALETIKGLPPDENGQKAPAAIVLMSDGKQTVGIEVDEAAQHAKDAGIAIWTIAFGTEDGSIEVDADNTGELVQIPVPVDFPTMQRIAETTGGKAFEAKSAADLINVYDTLRSAVGYDIEEREVTWQWIAAAMAAFGLVGIASIAWTQRLP